MASCVSHLSQAVSASPAHRRFAGTTTTAEARIGTRIVKACEDSLLDTSRIGENRISFEGANEHCPTLVIEYAADASGNANLDPLAVFGLPGNEVNIAGGTHSTSSQVGATNNKAQRATRRAMP